MQINALFAGKPAPFGPRGAPSSIIKASASTLTVRQTGTDEDEQGNKKLHGGPEKVLHQYSYEGYQQLDRLLPQHSFAPGTIGENLLVEGMHDNNVFIGDVYRFGEVVLQVSAPRAPCNKISHRFGIKNMDRLVGLHGITGWYYRVIETGVLNLDDSVSLVSRPDNTVSIAAIMQSVYDPALTSQAGHYTTLEVVDREWREKCRRRAEKAT
ncbi:MOSC domain-containing protein [Salinimonas lutimaris]|uniref:MOSC domain-containing protein n=1 Tax=Salinimonas lutimaris TaxID=914153 RepID=UPI0010BFD12C|nr:MOSC domain-containing protein [Salinimonas lutimaris]